MTTVYRLGPVSGRERSPQPSSGTAPSVRSVSPFPKSQCLQLICKQGDFNYDSFSLKFLPQRHSGPLPREGTAIVEQRKELIQGVEKLMNRKMAKTTLTIMHLLFSTQQQKLQVD